MSEPTGHRELDAAFDSLRAKVASASAPATLYADISSRLGPARRTHPYRWLVATAAVLVVAAATGALGYRWIRSVRDHAGFELVSASEDFRSIQQGDGAVVVERGRARLRVPELHVDLTVTGPSRLRRASDGIRVLLGAVDFDAAPRPASLPLRVFVSHGVIEVVGTRFSVLQALSGGRVALDSGTIRFVDERGHAAVLHAGETLTWPAEEPAPVERDRPQSVVAPATAPAAKPAPRLKGPRQESPVTRQQILGEIDALRMRRENDRLTERLTTWLAETTEEPFRERLSFELCDVLTQQPRDRRRACAQIVDHLRRYPDGEYTRPLQQTRALTCGEPESGP